MAGVTPFPGFPVIRRAPTERGRLYPTSKNRLGIFLLESSVQRPSPYGFTIDGSLTFDLDADRILAGVELLRPMNRWKLFRPFPDKPSSLQPADLEFAAEALQGPRSNVPVEVRSNPGKSSLLITLGPAQVGVRGVALSDACIALVERDHLAGFYVLLS